MPKRRGLRDDGAEDGDGAEEDEGALHGGALPCLVVESGGVHLNAFWYEYPPLEDQGFGRDIHTNGLALRYSTRQEWSPGGSGRK